jgi:hypothetical protein
MVQATICYPDGTRIDAILLAMDGHSMRLISRDGADTLELRLDRGKWSDEDGVPVELDALISDGQPVASMAELAGAGGAERLWQNRES